MLGVARRKREMVDDLVELHLANFETSGAELIMGEARFTEPKTVIVTSNSDRPRLVYGERLFLCVGSRATIPDVPGLASVEPMTHVEALNLERIPEYLVVLGGGYVGVECAQAMRRFGSRVTILQHGPQLLSKEDPEVSNALLDLMREEGIDVRLRTQVLNVTGRSGAGVKLRARVGDEEISLEASDILVAAGRTPNTDRLDAGLAGIDLDSRGYIQVNEKLHASAGDVWSMGTALGAHNSRMLATTISASC